MTSASLPSVYLFSRWPLRIGKGVSLNVTEITEFSQCTADSDDRRRTNAVSICFK
jgi:hypothetical protein